MVFEFVNAEAEDITVESTELHLLQLAAAWLDIANFKCICADGMKDMSCCTGSQQDFVLYDRTLSQQDWDIHSTVMNTMFTRVTQSSVWQEMLWTTHAGSGIPLTGAQRSELQESMLFAHGEFPVRTYSEADTASPLNTHSLWESCMSRVDCLFSTMQFKREKADESVVDVQWGLIEDFDPAGPTTPCARTAWRSW
jgi:hypothetical protein